MTTATACAASLSARTDTNAALAEAIETVRGKLDGPPELAFVFCTHDHVSEFEPLAARAAADLGAKTMLGAAAEGVLAAGREIEDGPAIAVFAARLPGAEIRPMRLEFVRSPDGGAFTGWPDDLPNRWPADSTLLLLGEPFSFPADGLLERLNQDQAGIPVLGGMAGGGSGPGENRLMFDGQVFADGAVGLLISGGPQVRPLVSQGCRPIGEPLVITEAERNVIGQLGGKPALVRLEEIFQQLPTRDQELVNRGLHVGLVVDEYQDERGQGDFLVRNVLGADRESGAISIGDFIRRGQTVQFHVRDASTADHELRHLVGETRSALAAAAGALLFSCNGRGTRMFEEPHHDIQCISGGLGDVPVAGFFAAGEIGPVAGKNFLHGFTASAAIFGATPATDA